MGTHFENPLLRPFKRLLRKKKKRLTPAEAERALAEMKEFLETTGGVTMHPSQSDRSIAPPKDIVNKVQGSSKAHPDTFIGGGAQTALQYMRLIEAAGVRLKDLGAMLDFGIGTGRVSLHFTPFEVQRYGCDVNDVAVDWCRDAYAGQIEIAKTGLEPPLPYDADSFDLVLATSVFTHTPYKMYAPWIAELDRVLRPGGAVAATVHDFGAAEAQAATEGYFETGTDRGLHINTYLTREHFVALFGARFDVRQVEVDAPNQAFFVAVKAA